MPSPEYLAKLEQLFQKIWWKIWRLLPDHCQILGCCRADVRGNENIINGQIVCDYCHAKMLEKETC